MTEMMMVSQRQLALLRATAEGRTQMLVGCGGNLAVDGAWCDCMAGLSLVNAGYIQPGTAAVAGSMVAATLTETGMALLRPVA
ncbi:hypothetical protein D5S17_17240 [Pseudonocardiaceae bacterium YIM PH 21723]|nr:hypothetical protein D5S17_17240 [Pseudonocardiaceae bacterium YIM PH 21723]